MAESDISTAIIRRLNAITGVHAIKFHSGPWQGRGNPDIFCSVNGRVVLLETKTMVGRTTRIQRYTH